MSRHEPNEPVDTGRITYFGLSKRAATAIKFAEVLLNAEPNWGEDTIARTSVKMADALFDELEKEIE